jgi:hypothetical protein
VTLKFKKTVATMKLYENKSKRHKMVLHASRCRQILMHIRYFHASGHSKNIYTEQNLYCPFSYITQFVTTFMLKKSYFSVLKYFKFYPMVCRIINLLNLTYKRNIHELYLFSLNTQFNILSFLFKITRTAAWQAYNMKTLHFLS